MTKLLDVSFASGSVHNPNQLWIKLISRSTLFRFEVRVLELDHPTTRGFHVCDMTFTGLGVLDILLPISRKLVFPGAMPFRFVLPPRIANATLFMSPVANPDFSAPCNHQTSADWTFA
jgi:hypothetical protein